MGPINGSTFDIAFSNNATTDFGYAPTTTDGTDGSWRDDSNAPVSEMGHMYYVNLGNLGGCTPDDAEPSGCIQQTGYGLTNTGPFSNIVSTTVWSSTELDSGSAWYFAFNSGSQFIGGKLDNRRGWAVRTGDVPAVVPVPPAVWLFGSGLIGLIGVARRKA